MRLQIPWLGLINEIPVLAKELLISLQLLLFHQDLLGCCFFFLNEHGWSAHVWHVYIKWGAQEQVFPCHLRRAAFFLQQHLPSQQGALLPTQQTPLYQNTTTQIPRVSCSSRPTSGSLTKALFSCATVAAALISVRHSFAGTHATSLAVLSWPHTGLAVQGLTFSWSAGFAGICSYFFRRENSSRRCPSSDGKGRNSLGIAQGGRS